MQTDGELVSIENDEPNKHTSVAVQRGGGGTAQVHPTVGRERIESTIHKIACRCTAYGVFQRARTPLRLRAQALCVRPRGGSRWSGGRGWAHTVEDEAKFSKRCPHCCTMPHPDEMPNPTWPTEPRSHRHPAALAAKLARLEEPHVAQLTAFARRIAAERAADVPLFDPASGGTSSRVLLLLESPGPRAATGERGSGLISMDNDDGTAANGFLGLVESGLPRPLTLNWNIVPWHLAAVRKPTPGEIAEAAPYLAQLVTLLPDLRVVVLLGKAAQEGWAVSGPGDVRTIVAPHPSPQNFNTRPASRAAYVAALHEAAEVAG